MLPQSLGPVEVRVAGSLIGKELSTPDHYPLSLNALISVCNQSSNRDPVMTLDGGPVSAAIDELVQQLGGDMSELRAQFAAFRKQFE